MTATSEPGHADDWADTGPIPLAPATHTGAGAGNVSQPTRDADGAREARYAEAIRSSVNGAWTRLPGPTDLAPSFARAVLPLADAEVEAATRELRAEVERLRANAAAVEALHWPHKSDVFVSGTEWCDAEGEDWPCPTVLTLRGAANVDPHPDIVGALETRAEALAEEREWFTDLLADVRWLRKRMDDPNARMDFIAHDADQIINNAQHLDHIDDHASTAAAHQLARQCPQCRKDQP